MDDSKETVKQLLREKKYQEILDRLGENRKTVRTLRAILYEKENLLRWRAVTMFGWLAASKPKLVKKEVDRLLWSMNDEAGYIGRSAPETLCEIGRNNYPIAKGAVKVVLEYLKDPETCRPPNRNIEILVGVLWGTARVGSQQETIVKEMVPAVESFLEDPDSEVRGHAAWCLGQIGFKNSKDKVSRLLADQEHTQLYEDEELKEMSVASIAEQAIQKLSF